MGIQLLLGLHLPVYLCFYWLLAHKFLHVSDSTMPCEVRFGEMGQLSNTENISMDACFFHKHLSVRMEVALLVVSPPEAGVPCTSNLSCDAVGSNDALYFG